MRIAIIHDWLVVYAGAEKVLEQLIKCYPDADIFSIVDFLDSKDRGFLNGKTVTTSFIQNLPFARQRYRNYLPLMPLAVELFDLSKYDLVISSSHAIAKGVITSPSQLHVCYCHTPIRYAWDLMHQYLYELNAITGVKGLIYSWLLHKIKIWDLRTTNSVDIFIANSKFISKRIYKYYRRESTVIYPPVSLYAPEPVIKKGDYYITMSRMVPYKKIPLIIQAFKKIPDKKLVVIGDGPDYEKCKKLASENVQLLGWQSFEAARKYLTNAKAFIFAAEEDFGIVPVEAQACGIPVIAYGRGGATESLIPFQDGHENSPTGILFDHQAVDSIIAAINLFERNEDKFTAYSCIKNAEKFSDERFRVEVRDLIDNAFKKFLEDK